MTHSYFVMVFITIASMATMLVHFFENETLSRKCKDGFREIATLIIIGVSCEFIGICLNNSSINLRYVHGVIKAIEFSIAPIISIPYVRIVKIKEDHQIITRIMTVFLLSNVICELVSIFTPFVFYIDDNNVYQHGDFYWIYILMYVSGVVYFIASLLSYTKKYQSRNIATLIAILVFLGTGLQLRFIDSSVNSDWLLVSVAYILFIVYYSDLSLKVDALTLLLNRKSYEHRLKKLDYKTAIIIFDANDFKSINDTYGHLYGDKILQVIAKTIMQTYGKYAHCYRIGGDEFCAILKNGMFEKLSDENKNFDSYKMLEDLNKKFNEALAQKYEQYPMLKNGVSIGFGIYYGLYDINKSETHDHYSLNSIKDVIKMADERMYKNKQSTKANKENTSQ